jgi:hypothetical protein
VYINCSGWFHLGISCMYIYCTLITKTSSITYSFSVALLPYYSTDFSAFHYTSSCTDALCFNSIHSLSFSFSLPLLQSPFRQAHYYNHVFSLSQSLSLSLYIRSYIYLCVYLSYRSSFHTWEKTCDLCLSEPGLLHLTWCSPVASIYLQTIILFFFMAE